ncbi:MAG TPA: hypothetical protein VIS72_06810 [Anaerolineales bacterium]
MSKIIGFEEIQSGSHLQMELKQGGKFVMYQYCVSLLVITFRRSSNIYFIRSGESAVVKGIPYTLLTLALGWWGIPWGPIYTIASVWTNFSGGKDVMQEVLASMATVSQTSG